MRHDQRLSEREIWGAALAAVEEAVHPVDEAAVPTSLKAIARGLGVTPSAVTKALAKPGTRYLKLQLRIIEHLSDFEVEGPIYIAKRKGSRP